jgi:predicted ATPase
MGLVETISLRHYSSAYDVHDVSLHDDLTVIVGPNGAGKSTFLEGTATFGSSYGIDDSTLSEYSSPLETVYQSRIPIATLEFSISDQNESLIGPLARRPEISSLDIDDNTLRTVTDEKKKLEGGLPPNKESLKVTRYANGTHKLQTSSGRYNLGSLIEKRIRDLQLLGSGLIEQALSIGLLDSPEDRTSLDSDTLSGLLEIMEERIDFDVDDENETPLELVVYNDFEKIINHFTNLERLQTDILEPLPTIAHFEEIPTLPTGVHVSDLKSETQYQGLLNWGGIDPEQADAYNKEELEEALNAGAEELTIFLNNYIQIEEPVKKGVTNVVTDPLKGRFGVECRIEDEVVKLYIQDDDEDTKVQLSHKSTGFQWLLSGILIIFSGVIDTDQTDLFLIDDIGVHLHPDWKIKLRKALHEITGDAQLVYSTHSPFFIDNGSLNQVRVASIDSEGTKIQRVSEAQGNIHVHDRLEPIRSSLGAYVAEFLFGASGIVITEGTTDRDYIKCFSEVFESSEDYPTLNKDIAIMNGKGTNQIVLANFLEAEQDNYYCLMDKDDSGNTQVDKFVESNIDEAKFDQIDILPNQVKNQHTEIEDLLPDELICELVAEEMPAAVKETDLINRVRSEPDKGVLEAIECRISRYKDEGDISHLPEIPKEKICNKLTSMVDESWLEATGDKSDSVEDFADIIDKINSKVG